MNFELKSNRVKQKLEDYLTISSMYDKRPNYIEFGKTLYTKRDKSKVGLRDNYDSIVQKAY